MTITDKATGTPAAANARRRPITEVEREAAFRLSSLMRREFGLTPVETSATLNAVALRVKMEDALTPMAQVIAQSPQGPEILHNIYALLLDANRLQMHQMVGRILGRPVWRSELTVDVPRGDVLILFELAAQPE